MQDVLLILVCKSINGHRKEIGIRRSSELFKKFTEDGMDFTIEDSLIEYCISQYDIDFDIEYLEIYPLYEFTLININKLCKVNTIFIINAGSLVKDIEIENIGLYCEKVTIENFSVRKVVCSANSSPKIDLSCIGCSIKTILFEGESEVKDNMILKRKISLHHCTVSRLSCSRLVDVFIRGSEVAQFQLNDIQRDVNDNTHLNYIGTSIEIEDTLIKEFFNKAILKCVKLVRTTVVNLTFFPEGKWIKNQIDNSIIENVRYCGVDSIVEKNEDSWELILRSAKLSKDINLYRLAGYELEDERASKYSWVVKSFLKYSTGYGYEPNRVVKFIPFIVLIFAILYQVSDSYIYKFVENRNCEFSINGIKNLLTNFLDRIYYSGITFTTTGYSEIGNQNLFIRFFSFIEACVGVCVLSMFVYSLTKTHLKE